MNEFGLKCLPRHFMDISRPSAVLDALYEKRQNAENQTIHELRAKKGEICCNYSKLFEERSQQLKEDLQDIQELIAQELHECQLKSLDSNATFMDQHHLRNLHSYSEQQNQLVANFFTGLTRMEINKSMQLTDALKTFYEKIKQIANRSPHECDEQIEKEIENVNQSIMCNHRNYAELKATLQSTIQNQCKLSIEQLQLVKGRWLKYVGSQSESVVPVHLKKPAASISVQSETPQQWLYGFRQTLGNLDQKSQNLRLHYKQAAMLIYNRSFTELQLIEDALSRMPDCQAIPQEQAEMYTPNLDEIPALYGTDLETIQPIWTNWMKKLSETIKTTCQFLFDAVTLWKRHFRRTEIVHLLILQQLGNAVKLNNFQEAGLESKLNVLIDTLRQASSPKKAQKAMEDVENILEVMGAIFEAHYQAEVALLKQYKGLLDMKIEVLVLEVKRFLEVHPPDADKDPKRQRKRASQTSNEPLEPMDAFLSNQMLFCGYQIEAISNWQFGVWEMVSNYLAVAKAELLQEEEQWYLKQVTRLDRSKKIRLNLHCGKLWTIQSYIFKERLKELCLHNQRMKEHKIAVEQGLSQLKSLLSSCRDFNSILSNYYNELQDIESTALDSKNSDAVGALDAILNGKTAKCSEGVQKATSDLLKKCQAYVNSTKSSHLLLFKQTKLFVEEGTFSAEELQLVLKEVAQLTIHIDKSTASICKQVDHLKTTMLERMQNKDAEVKVRLKSITQEHLFMETLQSCEEALQKKLLVEVCRFHKQSTELYNQFEQFKLVLLENCGTYCNCKQIAEKIKEMTEKLLEIARGLNALPVRLYSEKANSELRRSGGHSSKSRRRSTKALIEDTTKRLFNLKFDDEQNGYLANVNRMLLSNWNDTIAHASQFFAHKNHCFFLDGDKVIHNVVLLLSKLYPVYLNMQNQCETRAMQDTKTYLHFTSSYISFLNDYIDMYMDEFERSSIKEFEQFFETHIKSDLEKSNAEIRNLYSALHQKLRPLHGHPKNKSKLVNVQLEADKVCSQCRKIIGELETVHLTKLRQRFETIVSEYFDLYQQISEILQVRDSLQNALDALAGQLSEKEALLRSIVNHPPREYPEEVLSHCKSFLMSYDSQQSPGYHEVSNHIFLKPWDSFQGLISSAQSSVFNSILSESSFSEEEENDPFLIQLKARLNKYCQLVQKEDFAGVLAILQAEWNSAIKTVHNLYDVKYHK